MSNFSRFTRTIEKSTSDIRDSSGQVLVAQTRTRQGREDNGSTVWPSCNHCHLGLTASEAQRGWRAQWSASPLRKTTRAASV